jgi:hypothetical protein
MAWNEHTVIAEAAISIPEAVMTRIPEEVQADTLQRITDKFLFASDAAWWWEVLDVPNRTLSGRSVADIPNICPDPDAAIYFVPCDTRPLIVYRSTPRSSTRILNECPFFEYALIADDMSWMLIENHHGAFIVAGDLSRLNLTNSEQDVTLNA